MTPRNWQADFEQRLSRSTGILELMNDLGRSMAQGNMLMMGGGNPALIPEVTAIWRARLEALASTPAEVDRMLGIYGSPQGNPDVLEALAGLLNRHFDWGVTEEHIAVTGGGQTAFFFLFNLLAGMGPREGKPKKILFPIMPEYIGYADQALHQGMYVGLPPLVESSGDGTFKYRIDFDRLDITDEVAALCVSRPTNPTGNVLTDEEMRRLDALADRHGIPLIVDNAYGAPFPDILFTEAQPIFTERTILTMSLSKLGLPGVRTAFVVGPPEIIRAVAGMNAVVSLANNNIGQTIIRPMLEDDSILRISQDLVRPYYARRSRQTIDWLREAFGDRIPLEIHRSEGALFLWLRFPDLPVRASALYERLKHRRVLVVPGHYFFFGLEAPHPHDGQCIRVTFSQSEETVQEGIAILADEVRQIYAEGRKRNCG